MKKSPRDLYPAPSQAPFECKMTGNDPVPKIGLNGLGGINEEEKAL